MAGQHSAEVEIEIPFTELQALQARGTIMKTYRLSNNLKVILLLSALSLFLGGCAFFDLKKELKEIEDTYGLKGEVDNRSPHKGPLIVVLYAENNNNKKIVKYVLPDKMGHYSFLVNGGSYYLAAFEDLNHNFTYDEGEYYGYFGEPDRVIVAADKFKASGSKEIGDLNIRLTETEHFKSDLPVFVDVGLLKGTSYIKIGQLTTLDDEIFKQENGSVGYWKPLTFLRDFGVGIYFIEPYDPGKIPILFVHGANGTPVGWKTIVDSIDRDRYQPWFYYYPSGFRLDSIVRALNHLVTELHEEYRFNTLYVTAHSMGGLVSRAFIRKNVVGDNQHYIKKFVSISTPWGGIRTAEKGVKKAPVVIPSWRDVAPDSKFIQSIYKKTLPPEIEFYLFFGVRGKSSLFMANNDGVVEIASEIDYRAQKDAVKIFGFNEDHDSILTSQKMIEQYNVVLE